MSYLQMYRGDDRTLTITASESMEGADLRFTARHRRYDDDVVIEKAAVVGDDPFTSATVEIAASDTEDLEPDALYWDLELTDGTGKVHTVATGRLAILEDVSRASAGS